jgi:hypothetical protein
MRNQVRIAVAIPALLGFGLALMTFNTGRLIAHPTTPGLSGHRRGRF